MRDKGSFAGAWHLTQIAVAAILAIVCASLTGCGSAGKASASAAQVVNAPAVSFSSPTGPSTATFPPQLVGGPPSQQIQITVTNSGNQPLTITAVAVGGTNASDFSQTSPSCTAAAIAPGGTCTIGVTFTPAAAGSRSATLTLTDNAKNESIALSGTGTNFTATCNPSSCAVAGTVVGQTNTETITVANPVSSGLATLTISGLAFSGTNSGDFIATNNCTNAPIASGSSCTITVTFAPVTPVAGSRIATLTMTSNGTPSQVPVVLSGTSITQAQASLLSTSLDFTTQGVGFQSPAQGMLVTNTGSATLMLLASGIKLSGTNPGDFTATTSTCTSVPVGGTCNVVVTFKPTDVGTRSATVTLTDNAVPATQTFTVSGTGIATSAVISPTMVAFGGLNVNVPNPGSKVISVDNVSPTQSFQIAAINGVSGTPFSVNADGVNPLTLPHVVAPGQRFTFGVQFAPIVNTAFSTTLTIVTDTQGSYDVPLTGTGLTSPCNATTGYCSTTRTDLVTPSPLPNPFPTAGQIYVDTDLGVPGVGSRILRVTDIHTADAMNVCLSFVQNPPSCASRSWNTVSGAESNTWNADTTKFYILMNGNSRFSVYDFDAINFSATPDSISDAGAPSLINLAGGEPSWSHANPNIIYGFHTKFDHKMQQYDFSTGQYTQLLDLDVDCPGLVLLPTETNLTGLANSYDDNRVVFRAGGTTQNDERIVGIWDRTKGCTWYDVKNDFTGGSWGFQCTHCVGYTTTQIAAISGSHNARMSGDGKTLHLAVAGAPIGDVFWQPDAPTQAQAFIVCPDCQGHTVFGYDHFADGSGLTGGFWRVRQASDPNNTIVNLGPREDLFNDDEHASWNNDRMGTAQLPFLVDLYANQPTKTASSQVLTPTMAELLGIATDGSNVEYRFAHNRSWSGDSTQNPPVVEFFWTPRGNVSQDGRYFMFTSNMEQTLGQDLGVPQLLRTDIFVVELK